MRFQIISHWFSCHFFQLTLGQIRDNFERIHSQNRNPTMVEKMDSFWSQFMEFKSNEWNMIAC